MTEISEPTKVGMVRMLEIAKRNNIRPIECYPFVDKDGRIFLIYQSGADEISAVKISGSTVVNK